MKKMISILVVILMILTVGCVDGARGTSKPASADDTATNVPSTDKRVEEIVISEVTSSPVEEQTASPTAEVETPGEDDYYKVLEVSETFASEYGGAYLKRNGKLYSLTKIPIERAVKTGVGQRSIWDYSLAALLIQGIDNYYLTAGEVPIFIISEGDELVSYKDSSIGFLPAVFRGYSVRVLESVTTWGIYCDPKTGPTEIRFTKRSEFQVLNSEGQKEENIHDIEYGEDCFVTWFEGTTYKEYPMVADCEYYYAGPPEGEFLMNGTTIDGTLTKNGYATYDLSVLEPGAYIFGASGHFGIIMIG